MEKEELKQRCLDAIDANRDLIIQLGDDLMSTVGSTIDLNAPTWLQRI